ncbi:MAG: glycerol-3-phosphate 1-O-acyltransferase PlsY [Oscillatoriales cyanobacterium SM2_2_1]|nr:glycerol-3-phosphate 1-O-acyltransferase PlsY [Oscillatoriales cyanobacterium SM2_2_1]
MNFLWLAIAYGLGSIPTGYLVGKWAGIDIREHGSGSTGATNIWRTVGKAAGAGVFTVDLLKGALAVGLMQRLGVTGADLPFDFWVVGAAMAALLGHSCPVWLGFRGGKSVATGLGVLLVLQWQVALGALGCWLVTMTLSRIVSLSSLVAAIATMALMIVVSDSPVFKVFAVVGGSYIFWTHRSNIDRLLRGTESSFRAQKPELDPNLNRTESEPAEQP